MYELDVAKITESIRALCIKVNTQLPEDVEHCLRNASAFETSPFGRYALEQIVDNARLAREQEQAMCQDTGIAVVFIDIGQDLHLVGGDVNEAIEEGVRRGYRDGYLRASMVSEPVFERQNTGDNTPPVVHMRMVRGTNCRITVMPKGGGAENMGALGLLKPTVGEAGVHRFVLDTVEKAGGNPCPPIIVGVGIGGSIEKAAELAKRALMRQIGSSHEDPRYAELERNLLHDINATGIGPQGLGGLTTALAVHIETFPTHIAMLPVVVNINCHAARHHTIVLYGEEA